MCKIDGKSLTWSGASTEAHFTLNMGQITVYMCENLIMDKAVYVFPYCLPRAKMHPAIVSIPHDTNHKKNTENEEGMLRE